MLSCIQVLGSSLDSDMATSFEQNKNNIFNTRPSVEKFISKIPTRNNSSINKTEKSCKKSNGGTIEKPDIQKINAKPSRALQQSQASVMHRKTAKSGIQTQTMQASWAVQPTEHAGLTHYSHSVNDKSKEKQKLPGKSKRTFTKIQRKIQRITPKEVKTPKTCLQYESQYQAPEEMFSKPISNSSNDAIGDYDQVTYRIRDEKPVFRLNSETMKEIEALGDCNTDFMNLKQEHYPPNTLVNEKSSDGKNNVALMNMAEECQISSLLCSRTEQLLRSNRKPKRQTQSTKEKG